MAKALLVFPNKSSHNPQTGGVPLQFVGYGAIFFGKTSRALATATFFMILQLFHVFQILLFFVVEKLQPFYIGQSIPKEPPGPTAIFQGTFKNHPEAPKEPQGAPKSSQGAPRDPPGALKSPSFCPASSLRNPRGPSSTARELPRNFQGPPSSTQESFLLPIVLKETPGVPRSTSELPKTSQEPPGGAQELPSSP